MVFEVSVTFVGAAAFHTEAYHSNPFHGGGELIASPEGSSKCLEDSASGAVERLDKLSPFQKDGGSSAAFAKH
jgi:hypothetical protein